MFSFIKKIFTKKQEVLPYKRQQPSEEHLLESINVEKIVRLENDLDFLKNKLLFDYKRTNQLSSVELHKLLHYYQNTLPKETQNHLDSDNKPTEDLLIQIAESNDPNDIKTCLKILEKRI